MPGERDQLKRLLDSVDKDRPSRNNQEQTKSNGSSRMVNYKRKLKTGEYRYITDDIDDRFSTTQPDWTKYVAVLHKVVADEVDYHLSGSQVPLASEMLDRLSGDCQDQTVLLSNLFVAAGFDVRMISVEHMGDTKYHVLPQVRVPEVKDTAPGKLRDAYEEMFNWRPDKMAWTTIDGEPYFIADPEWSSYVGDRSTLTGDYIKETSSGWTWYNIRDEWRVNSKTKKSKDYSVKKKSRSSKPSSTKSSNQEKMSILDQLDHVADGLAEAWEEA